VVSRRVYVTPKGSWVYFERSDVNWDQWRSGESLEPGAGEMSASFDPATREGRRIFEVRDSLEGLAGVAPEELLSAARAAAEDTTSPVERLDI
jgi:EXLDI family protein